MAWPWSISDRPVGGFAARVDEDIDPYTPDGVMVAAITERPFLLPCLFSRGGQALFHGLAHGAEDVLVAGAAAQVS